MNKVTVIILEAIGIAIELITLPFAFNKGDGIWIITNILFIIVCVIGLFVTIFYPDSKSRAFEESPHDDLSEEQVEMIKEAERKHRNTY